MNISSNDILKNISNKNEIKNILSKEIIQTDVKAPIGAQAKDESIKTLLDSLFKDLSLNLKTKDNASKILQDKSVAKDIKETSSNLKSIIADLKNDKTLLKSTNILDKLILDIKNIDAKTLQQQIKQSGLFLESKLLNLDKRQSLLPKSIIQTLHSLKNIYKNTKINVATIDKVLNAKIANKDFINDIKQIVTDSKSSKNQSTIDTVAKLENLVLKSQAIESKIINEFELKHLDIKENIKNISTVLSKFEALKPKIKEIITQISQDISKIQNTPNLNKTEFLKLNISQKLQRVVNLIKSDLLMQEPKVDVHVEISKLAQFLKDDVKTKITNKQIVPNQQLQASPNPKNEILYDIKANLLQLKDELSKTSNPNKTDTLNKIDKVLTSINYYQLASFSNGSNILYLPLLWDGLDEGQISIKKLKQKRFFCEINLKLKDYGRIDLLIMLFDKININISIFTQSDEFLHSVKENLLFLKQGINSLGLIPTNIYMFDSLKDDKIKRDTKSYVDGEQIGEGVNIHV